MTTNLPTTEGPYWLQENPGGAWEFKHLVRHNFGFDSEDQLAVVEIMADGKPNFINLSCFKGCLWTQSINPDKGFEAYYAKSTT